MAGLRLRTKAGLRPRSGAEPGIRHRSGFGYRPHRAFRGRQPVHCGQLRSAAASACSMAQGRAAPLGWLIAAGEAIERSGPRMGPKPLPALSPACWRTTFLAQARRAFSLPQRLSVRVGSAPHVASARLAAAGRRGPSRWSIRAQGINMALRGPANRGGQLAVPRSGGKGAGAGRDWDAALESFQAGAGRRRSAQAQALQRNEARQGDLPPPPSGWFGRQSPG